MIHFKWKFFSEFGIKSLHVVTKYTAVKYGQQIVTKWMKTIKFEVIIVVLSRWVWMLLGIVWYVFYLTHGFTWQHSDLTTLRYDVILNSFDLCKLFNETLAPPEWTKACSNNRLHCFLSVSYNITLLKLCIEVYNILRRVFTTVYKTMLPPHTSSQCVFCNRLPSIKNSCRILNV